MVRVDSGTQLGSLGNVPSSIEAHKNSPAVFRFFVGQLSFCYCLMWLMPLK